MDEVLARRPSPDLSPDYRGEGEAAPRPSRLGLRAKLWVGFGGLFAMLLAASGMGAVVLTHYSSAYDRIFKENYDSVTYGERMMEALDGLDYEARRAAADGTPLAADAVGRWERQFDDNMARQQGNCYLPGEQQMTDAAAADWGRFRADYDRFAAAPAADRPRLYRDTALPAGRRLWLAVQDIRGRNFRNIAAVDAQVRATMGAFRTALLAVAAVGAVLALAYAGVVVPRLLRPLSALTRSARQIADGRLDLDSTAVAPAAAGRDEVGQLAEAFNVMAERLREFRRLDRERLARTEQTTQMAVDSLPDAVVVLNPDGRIELANRMARDRFGLVPAAENPADVSAGGGGSVGGGGGGPPAWMTALHEEVMRTGRAVEPQTYRSAVQRFDGGDERFYLPHATPLTADGPMADDGGRVVGVTVILSDITRLKQADEARSDLVSTVSHELKTPLTAIRMATHMLADQESFGPLSDRQSVLLATARDNADRLFRTVEHLLGIGRLESGRAPLRLQPVPAADVIAQAVDPLRPVFAGRGVDVVTPDPPPTSLSVQADPASVGYVLTNLLTNAARHAPAGTAVVVGCEAAADDTTDDANGDDDADGAGWVRFTVRDDGPGIAPEHVPHLFDKFYRVPGPAGGPGTPGGAGLGLAIVRDVVHAHGGRAGVDTAPGRGATFWFCLRRA